MLADIRSLEGLSRRGLLQATYHTTRCQQRVPPLGRYRSDGLAGPDGPETECFQEQEKYVEELYSLSGLPRLATYCHLSDN